ncbi:MAG: 23S rRNA (guanosine(2251)-2'-O)-methyltransferase RlmB [Gammaproteobacteria bacterium]|nr:23S rRNA (guanosine(2251)-2'-O)-methyltransferase RlmB [Gammaproteobacteria bacterium]MBU1980354.1 23S rRNA (guanosine(2251)-2'-O)-methyltransferase RlmB [Gammaproteobacteria bacterium]
MADNFIYGFHAIVSRIRQDAKSVTEIYLHRERQDPRARDLLQLAEEQGVRVIFMERHRLDGMAGNDKHQGVVAKVVAAREYHDVFDVLESLKEPALLLVLDGVQDPHNLGACLRVADAMGAHAVVVPKDRAAGLNATVRKVASGAAETVPFVTVTNLSRSLREIKEAGVWVVGAAGEAETDLFSAKLEGPTAWVLGAEGEGLRRLTRETCDQLIRIPMFGSVESLNVSVASGICLYETRRQRNRI